VPLLAAQPEQLSVNMRIPINIDTHDRLLGFNIAGKNGRLSSRTVVEAPGGVKVEYQGSLVRKSFGIPEVLQLIVEVSKDVEIGLFSAWLYDKVQNRPVERITIRRTEITEITEAGIRKVLEEEITRDS
jgi:hypothetical protein